MHRLQRSSRLAFLSISLLCFLDPHAPAQAPNQASGQTVDNISPDLRGRIDRIATQVLEATGVPSASIAVVQHGKLVYTHAYGFARLAADSVPAVPATPTCATPSVPSPSSSQLLRSFFCSNKANLASTTPSANTFPALRAATRSPSAKFSRTPPDIRTTGPRTTS